MLKKAQLHITGKRRTAKLEKDGGLMIQSDTSVLRCFQGNASGDARMAATSDASATQKTDTSPFICNHCKETGHTPGALSTAGWNKYFHPTSGQGESGLQVTAWVGLFVMYLSSREVLLLTMKPQLAPLHQWQYTAKRRFKNPCSTRSLYLCSPCMKMQ